MRIAVLSKDDTASALICETLNSHGHACELHEDGGSLRARPAGPEMDLLLIDWQTTQDCTGLLAEILAGACRLPVMAITGRSCEDDIAAAMDAGVADVIVKPLRRAELTARVQALLKRAYPELRTTQRQDFGTYSFETTSARVMRNGEAIALTQKEFELALLFFHHLERPLSRAYIQDAIWPGQEGAGRSVDTHVSRVRSKLGLRPENGFRLAPVYSYGYRLQKLD